MNTEPTEIELLPCPFCGSDQVELEQEEYELCDWYIQCYGCYMTTGSYSSAKAVAEKWNRRVERNGE